MTEDSLIARAEQLHHELYWLHAKAKRMAIDDMRRWKLSLRAKAIADELEELATHQTKGETA